jgi:hypothetical protein
MDPNTIRFTLSDGTQIPQQWDGFNGIELHRFKVAMHNELEELAPFSVNKEYAYQLIDATDSCRIYCLFTFNQYETAEYLTKWCNAEHKMSQEIRRQIDEKYTAHQPP